MAFWDKKNDDEKVELPKELEDRFKGVETAVTSKIEERLKGLDSLVDFAKEYKSDKEKAEQQRIEREAAEARKEADKNRESPEDLAARMLSDPASVISDVTKPQAELVLQLRADNIRREVFQDNANDFPYYDGEIKREIDTLLSKQSLKFQNDRESVANVYHTVVGRKLKDINEGKIKSRFASSTSSRTGSPGSEEGKEEKIIKVTPEIERAAKLSGMTTEKYVELLKNDEEFDYV